MSSIRVSDLAKKLQTSPADLMAALEDLGVPVESESGEVDSATAELVEELFAEKAGGIAVPADVVVRDFADLINTPPNKVQEALIGIGVFATLTQTITFDVAEKVANKLGVQIRKGSAKASASSAPKPKPKAKTGERSAWVRPPVVTVLGHVDHGKTSLLDAIRNAHVTESEFGGITQHIGAYQVTIKGKLITFIDTPGHAAFTAMRARGAQVTDIAVLVVAADDGPMPQTREAINHARAAEVPIIVAVNKVDKEDANPDRTKQMLAELELIPEEWGGDTMFVNVSATQRTGIDDLLESILVQAEVMELTADPAGEPEGVVVESRLERGRGAVATVLVQNGTLKIGTPVVVGSTWGRIKAMVDDQGNRVQKAGPSTPVELVGLESVPAAGEQLLASPDERSARTKAEGAQDKLRNERMSQSAKVSLEDLYRKLQEGESKELRIILRSDVDGSAEAIRQSLQDLGTSEVVVKVIQSAVGAVGEGDVLLAAASDAIVVAFNVKVEKEAYAAAEKERVEIRQYNIIYELLDDVRKAMAGLLEPERREEITGHAEVRALFKTPRGVVAGSYVQDGRITRNSFARLLRGKDEVWSGKVDSLRHFKDDVREMAAGFECGIQLDGFNDVKEGDIIEAYLIQEVARTL